MAREINVAPSMGSGFNTAEEEKKKQEEEKAKAQQQEQAPAPARLSSGAAAPTTPTIKSMPKPEQAGTGSFANLKSYLSAAQSGGQQRIAQAATKSLESAIGGAKKGIEQATGQFKQQVQASGLQLTPEEAAARTQAAINQALAATYTPPAQTTQPQPTTTTTTTQAPPAPTTPAPYVSQEAQQQYQDIINAQYTGPLGLQQAGLYETAAEKARAAQEALKNAQTATGREQLLRNVFGGARDYTAGQSKLDALLLNTSQQGLSDIQKQTQQAGNIAQQLQAAEMESGAIAEQRKKGLEGIRKAARGELVGARAKEEKAVESRLKKVETDWNKLTNYFKNLLKEKKTGQKLSKEEAAVLGLREGQSLFGIDENAIKATQRDSEKLVKKDEIVRQLALQQLANLDTTAELRKELKYKDLKKAGTQNILQSLDVPALQKELAEREKNALKEAGLKNAKLIKRFFWGMNPKLQKKNLLDVLKEYGNYTSSTDPNAPLTQGGIDYLKSIAEGKAYLPSEKPLDKGVVDKVLENYRKTIRKDKFYKEKLLAENFKKQLVDPLTKLGFSDVASFAENAQTKARAAALRKLLGSIYESEK